MAVSARVSGNVAEPGSTQINNVTLNRSTRFCCISSEVPSQLTNTAYTTDDIDRACLHALQCPNPLHIKTRLKEKDKLLFKSFEWILQDEQYAKWQNNEDVSLLWIKGGAGKGKTMTSVGLIEQLGRPLHPNEQLPIVAYFFCQNDDYKLNNIGGILKGLILSLLNQRPELFAVLRHKWDTANWQFEEDLTSWRPLWKILLDMLQHCKSMRLFVVIDALDECQDHDMPTFLQLIVRTGLGSDVKWLLTSRPFDSAGSELLSAPDQLMVSLELNSKHVTKAVQSYIHVKVAWLTRQNHYEQNLREQIEAELNSKAEDTYLWVSLVCKSLDGVKGADVMTTLAELPPGLIPLYRKMFGNLCKGERIDVESCIRLLKVMLTVYRPLRVEQVSSASDLGSEQRVIDRYIDLCASFVTIRGASIEFVHKSARDFLAGEARAYLDSYQHWGHDEIALSCVSCLSQQLKVNLLDLPQYDSGRESIKKLTDMAGKEILNRIEYAAAFWVQHLVDAQPSTIVADAICDQGKVVAFLHAKVLEWFECLSLLEQLPHGVDALRLLADTSNPGASFLAIVRDADRFLLRHYNTIANWPLQLYSSAISLSPQHSVLRTRNLDKKPQWLKDLPRMEATWTPLVQTLRGHSAGVTTVAFSPDSYFIVSGSTDMTVKLWDATTGDLLKTFRGHRHSVTTVTFLLDRHHIASGSRDKTIKLWNLQRNDCHKTFVSHLGAVTDIAFSKRGNSIASASEDMTVKLWDAETCICQMTFDHSDLVRAVAFSPDGKLLASACDDKTIKLWDVIAGGTFYAMLWDAEYGTGHRLQFPLKGARTIAFSHDREHIASGDGNLICVHNVITSENMILEGHSNEILAVAYSPDGKHIASASYDNTINLWDPLSSDGRKRPTDKRLKKTILSPDGKFVILASSFFRLLDAVTGEDKAPVTREDKAPVPGGNKARVSLVRVNAIAFSPDSKNIALAFPNGKLKIHGLEGGNEWSFENPGRISCIAFAPDGKHIALSSWTGGIKLWNITEDTHKSFRWFPRCRIDSMAFSSDGKHIIFGSCDGKVNLCDLSGRYKTIGKHSGSNASISEIAISKDGRWIASSCVKMIRIWDVAKATYSSVLSRFNDCLQREIEQSETMRCLRFSEDGTRLMANGSTYSLNDTAADTPGYSSKFSPELFVSNMWLCYGNLRLLRLAPNCEPKCQDTRGDRVVVGLMNGQVLMFEIDRAILDRELRSSRICF